MVADNANVPVVEVAVLLPVICTVVTLGVPSFAPLAPTIHNVKVLLPVPELLIGTLIVFALLLPLVQLNTPLLAV